MRIFGLLSFAALTTEQRCKDRDPLLGMRDLLANEHLPTKDTS